jgi:hypothetical protein
LAHMRLFLLALFVSLISAYPVEAHRSGCHAKHSCPSDSGSYTCGDKGYCSQCPDTSMMAHSLIMN